MVSKRGLAAAMNCRIYGGGGGGGGETVVLAHGYGTDQSVWDKVGPRLAARSRVVVFDWCFAGSVGLYDAQRYGSYDAFADDLIAVMDELKVPPAVFVGHSMAGMIGCIASVKRPDLFRRLVLVGPSPRLANTEDYEGGFDMSGIEKIFSSIESDFDQWSSTFASLVIDSSDQISIQLLANLLKRMGRRAALPLAKTVFLGDYRGVLENVTTACHIIHTRGDIIVPDSVPSYMKSKIKGDCEVLVIDTQGHFPQLTNHEQFIEIIDRILDGY
ncbi:strigolactone esterase D14 [Andrographis paniculata]|uniref:strigolactone esterase D14 n=1 Tax=Andrographis paniculata TaxID=175694 RepID=UPI0021E92EA3|nr:strigolactone esterase D14 [Andrographis paniculata]